jgi:hypothetical protein
MSADIFLIRSSQQDICFRFIDFNSIASFSPFALFFYHIDLEMLDFIGSIV